MIPRYNVLIEHRHADLSQPANAVADILDEDRKVDILVNNAGIQRVNTINDFLDDDWNAIVAVNLTAPFMLTRAVLPGMTKRKWGRIINVASVHGLVASAQGPAYVACVNSRAALSVSNITTGREHTYT